MIARDIQLMLGCSGVLVEATPKQESIHRVVHEMVIEGQFFYNVCITVDPKYKMPNKRLLVNLDCVRQVAYFKNKIREMFRDMIYIAVIEMNRNHVVHAHMIVANPHVKYHNSVAMAGIVDQIKHFGKRNLSPLACRPVHKMFPGKDEGPDKGTLGYMLKEQGEYINDVCFMSQYVIDKLKVLQEMDKLLGD